VIESDDRHVMTMDDRHEGHDDKALEIVRERVS
jgi:hypothetical protein